MIFLFLTLLEKEKFDWSAAVNLPFIPNATQPDNGMINLIIPFKDFFYLDFIQQEE